MSACPKRCHDVVRLWASAGFYGRTRASFLDQRSWAIWESIRLPYSDLKTVENYGILIHFPHFSEVCGQYLIYPPQKRYYEFSLRKVKNLKWRDRQKIFQKCTMSVWVKTGKNVFSYSNVAQKCLFRYQFINYYISLFLAAWILDKLKGAC